MRIFISSTTRDLAAYRGKVITQLMKAGHLPVCMEHHTASDVIPVDECLRDVASSELYVGIFAWRYGYIPPLMDKSITEMEYRKAVEIGIPAFIFLMDEKAEFPAEHRDCGRDGERINALREELKVSKWVAPYTNPDSLASEVNLAVNKYATQKMEEEFERALQATKDDVEIQKAALREAIKEERERLQRKRDRMPVSVPDRLTEHFQDRDAEIAKLRQALSRRDLRMVSICGRGGVGKTALAAKLIRELNQIGHSESPSDLESIEGILYIPLNEKGMSSPDTIVNYLARTLDFESSEKLKYIWRQDGVSMQQRLTELFRGPLARHRCLIVLDNMESVMDAGNRISEEFVDLRKFMEAFLEYKNDILLVVTSRRAPTFSPEAEIASLGKTVQISLEGGLPETYAIALLRELDVNGDLGIRNALEETLRRIAQRCQNIPRTLETLAITLSKHRTWTLETLLADEPLLDRLIENPAQELYMSLRSRQEQLVMQALAVYDRPVPAVAIRAILPALPIDEILDAFASNSIASFARGRFWLHPLDRSFAYGQIPEEESDYSKSVLHSLAARYFLAFPCPPKGSRTSLDEITPRLSAIEHLMPAGEDEDAARKLLEDGLLEDLHWWGHYFLLTDLCRRFLDRKISARQRIPIHIQLGKVERNLGNLEKAKKVYEGALPFISEAADAECEIGLLNALGDISYFLGDMPNVLKYLRRAEELLVLNPNPLLHSENSGDIGNVKLTLNELEEAKQLYEQAIAFSREAKNKIYEGIWNGNLGALYEKFFKTSGKPGDRECVISSYQKAIEIGREMMDRRHESHWKGALGNFYRELKEFNLAERHLREALSLSHKSHYRRGLLLQVSWVAALANDHVMSLLQKQELKPAFRTCLAYSRIVKELDIVELDSQVTPRLHECILVLINTMANEGRIEEVFAWVREYIDAVKENTENCAALGAIVSQLAALSGSSDSYLLSAETYSRAIRACSEEKALPSLYDSRGTAYARAGKVENALDDYAEVIKRNPLAIEPALSRAEILIWVGRYREAKIALNALRTQLASSSDITIYDWLMAHVKNLEGEDFCAELKALEEAEEKGVRLTYGVKDIEPYIRQLEPTKFSPAQIQNAWRLQALIIRLSAPSSSQAS